MLSNQEMIDRTNEAIADLVYDKTELLKAYNYYAGKRDPELYRYLEENYGIGNPTSVEFTPMIKKHVDALLGEYLGFPIIPKISCKDEATISNIGRDKQLKIKASILEFLRSHLTNAIILLINQKDPTDAAIKDQIDKIIKDINQSFISEYEIAALNVVQYIMQARLTDLITKLRLILLDLLITGANYYRVTETPSKTNILFEVLDPLNTFIDRNPDSIYVKDSYRVVVRRWLTKTQILNKYGRELTREEIETIKSNWQDHGEQRYYGVTYGTEKMVIDARLVNEPRPGYPDRDHTGRKYDSIPVYEVEWIEVDKDFVMLRYQTIRIGTEIFITKGIDKNVVRTQDNPSYCGLSVNGVIFTNRSNQPYSLVLACASLLDKYDLLIYYRDLLIANSGSKGQIVDLSMIPTNLGVNFPERILKWLAYRKAGTLMIDTSLEGRNDSGNAPLNTLFNGYDDTISAQAIQAIQMAIDSVEATTSSITGVFRERLNGIEQRDAVSNIKQGITNSFTITKPYYQLMDLVVCEMLTDGLNLAKTTWKLGLTGTLVLGETLQKIFTALPEHFTVTDFDIHILSTTLVMEDMLLIRALIPEFVKSGVVTPDIIFECLTTKSLTDLKYKVSKAIAELREENNQIQQLTLKLEETSKLLELVQSEFKKALGEIKQLTNQNMQLEQHKIQLEYQVNSYKAQTERDHWHDWYKIENRKVAIEEAQLHDGNPYNDEVNFKA